MLKNILLISGGIELMVALSLIGYMLIFKPFNDGAATPYWILLVVSFIAFLILPSLFLVYKDKLLWLSIILLIPPFLCFVFWIILMNLRLTRLF